MAPNETEFVNFRGLTIPRSTPVLMLAALQGKPLYQGTVPAATVTKNRKANKVARRQRRVNRLTNARKGVR